ncbi:hypothetical protein Lsed01_02500 [Demequina sediminis]|uniref:Uncharacterized protein n=1 Tax=Demequina sediminis TaxID=1930058 RepID=A0ABP9WK00_9MICO|nr:hypothetical protein [Demequina sediminis]BDZ61104.1 hypothetical protein GCM10025873_08950 [Demequina sediminis]
MQIHVTADELRSLARAQNKDILDLRANSHDQLEIEIDNEITEVLGRPLRARAVATIRDHRIDNGTWRATVAVAHTSGIPVPTPIINGKIQDKLRDLPLPDGTLVLTPKNALDFTLEIDLGTCLRSSLGLEGRVSSVKFGPTTTIEIEVNVPARRRKARSDSERSGAATTVSA